MTEFSDRVLRLGGQITWLLGWHPDLFWAATPAELCAILNAAARPDGAAAPVDRGALNQMMETER